MLFNSFDLNQRDILLQRIPHNKDTEQQTKLEQNYFNYFS